VKFFLTNTEAPAINKYMEDIRQAELKHFLSECSLIKL